MWLKSTLGRNRPDSDQSLQVGGNLAQAKKKKGEASSHNVADVVFLQRKVFHDGTI